MIIKTEKDVTKAVLSELERVEDSRIREILQTFVNHLHNFAREVKLTEPEFHRAIDYINKLGQFTTQDHNEGSLMSGTLGFSALVCLLNNGNYGQTETTANLLGPFWRSDSPEMENGDSIVRSPTPGIPLFATIRLVDPEGYPVSDVTVDVWHSSSEGYYENQDPSQADWNLRGQFTSDDSGEIRFRSIKPSGYPIPVNGPVGDLVRIQKRHNMRPAHLHFLAFKPGYKTHISQVYSDDDPYLETDVQFGVTERLIGKYKQHQNEPSPDPEISDNWYSLIFTLLLEPGEMKLPKPPITEKATGVRPDLEILERSP